jgi:hypothetical protein
MATNRPISRAACGHLSLEVERYENRHHVKMMVALMIEREGSEMLSEKALKG